MSPQFSCHLFSWKKPLLPQLVDYLLQKSTTDTPLSLDHLLIIAPTRQSGRRLLEALTQIAHQHEKGLLPPLILTPDALLRRSCSLPVASKSLVLTTWTNVLMETKASIATPPPNIQISEDTWFLQIARQLERVQSQVGPYGLSFSQIAAKTNPTNKDPERWQQLAELEHIFRERLKDMGKLCPQEARLLAAQHPTLPSNTRHILLASPSPSPLILQLMQAAQQQGISCTVLQYGPNDPQAWDEYGLPAPKFWHQQNLRLSDRYHFHVSYGPHELASTLYQQLRSLPADQPCAIGIPDPQLLPAIEQELTNKGIAAYNPSGQALHFSEAGRLLLAIQDFLRQSSFHATWNLLRHPAFFQVILRREGLSRGRTHQHFLSEIDKLEENHLCHSMESLRDVLEGHSRQFPCMQVALLHLEDWQRMAKENHPEQALEEVLLQFIGDRTLAPSIPEDRAYIAALQELSDILQQFRELRTHFPDISQATFYSLLGSQLQEAIVYAERPANSIDLQGWLEMLWEPSPHLILAGMHNDVLPSHIRGDAFLPERLREFIGIETNLQRSGIDAYLLHSVLECRRETGQVEMLLARWGVDNQIIHPSPLLLHIKEEDVLLRQVRDLIQYQPPLPQQPQRTFPTPIHLPVPEDTKKTIPITAFKVWLDNPFDFLLQHRLHWKIRHHRKQAMNEADIGNLLHHTMEACIPTIHKEQLPHDKIVDLFETKARELLQKQYGNQPHFLLELQWENIKKRLYHCATIEEELIQEGWTILHIEQKLSFPLRDYTLHGRIDRIDYHSEKNLYRIIDYKTGSNSYSFSKKIVSRTAPLLLPEIEFTKNTKGKEEHHRWTDLQMPLYCHAVQHAFPAAENVNICIFSIPSALGKIELNPIDMTPSMVQAALCCADAILKATDNNLFWAQRESRHFSEFFPDGAEHMLNLQPLSFPNPEEATHS
jgi:ATP-dependent helicase/nuclease subunit B